MCVIFYTPTRSVIDPDYLVLNAKEEILGVLEDLASDLEDAMGSVETTTDDAISN